VEKHTLSVGDSLRLEAKKGRGVSPRPLIQWFVVLT